MELALKNIFRLFNLYQVCLKNNIPFVAYRLPNTSNLITLIQESSFPEKINIKNQIDSISGFILAPFEETNLTNSYLLKSDLIIRNDNFDDSLVNSLSENFHFKNFPQKNGEVFYSIKRNKFIDQVRSIKQIINKGHLDKLVLSRIETKSKSENFSCIDLFHQLCNSYSNAFIYLLQLPEIGCWIGATPEPLIIIKDKELETVSLAGTQTYNNKAFDKITWDTKEIQEQDYVTRYIEKIIHKAEIDEYKIKGPFNQKAANLVHLKTTFKFTMNQLQGKLGEFIDQLHPTPSICGLPKSSAKQYLKEIENHQREYYTGFLGPHNIDNESHLYVNLRCMKVLSQKLVFYIGAGITSSSDADKEWEETRNKMMTLSEFIHNHNSKHE